MAKRNIVFLFVFVVAICVINMAFCSSSFDHEHILWEPKFQSTIPTCNSQQERNKLSNTNCPNNDQWLNGFSKDLRSIPTIVVVGCNKGVDAVRLFAQYDTRSTPFRLKDWKSALQQEPVGRGACGQVFGATELLKPIHSEQMPNVYCIEPMPSNLQLLHKLATKTRIPHKFKILPYALGVSQWPRQLPFPLAKVGTEHLGLASTGNPTVMVNTSTVDQLFQGIRIDMLLIDTEGNDPLVLLGASRVLHSVSYLEFENHGTGEWKTFKLKTIIDYLDNLEFDCWWTTNQGTLVRITRCWHDDYANIKRWSNIACAKRFDSRWKVMNSIATKP